MAKQKGLLTSEQKGLLLEYARRLRDDFSLRELPTAPCGDIRVRAVGKWLGLPEGRDTLAILKEDMTEGLIRKLEMLAGPNGHTIFKAVMALET